MTLSNRELETRLWSTADQQAQMQGMEQRLKALEAR